METAYGKKFLKTGAFHDVTFSLCSSKLGRSPHRTVLVFAFAVSCCSNQPFIQYFPCIMISIYQWKSSFQGLLRPLARRLAAVGVTAISSGKSS
ncbi:MAG: hypothetical protein LBP99_09770 [Azoarcus sp.]|jgi:hypothetical protein|nr:hypothetical protein [Azoarcus sp.]